MKRRSPTLEGFRVIFRLPSVGLAEITWRWVFAAAAASLLGFAFLEYLDTLPVSETDLFLLRMRHPLFVSRAIAHILRGSAPRVVEAAILLTFFLAFCWILLASAGRSVTLKALVNYFGDAEKPAAGTWGGLAGLNFLRAAATIAAGIGCVGALILGGMASSDKDPSPGSAMLIFLTTAMILTSAWSTVNWFLSLASVFVVRDGADTFGAIAATMSLCRDRLGAVLAPSIWFGLGHTIAFIVASSVVAFPLAFAGVLPVGVVLGGVLFVSLAYFAIADLLYMGRLAAYTCLVGEPDVRLAVIAPSEGGQSPNYQASDRVDPTESILSDLSPRRPDDSHYFVPLYTISPI